MTFRFKWTSVMLCSSFSFFFFDSNKRELYALFIYNFTSTTLITKPLDSLISMFFFFTFAAKVIYLLATFNCMRILNLFFRSLQSRVTNQLDGNVHKKGHMFAFFSLVWSNSTIKTIQSESNQKQMSTAAITANMKCEILYWKIKNNYPFFMGMRWILIIIEITATLPIAMQH